jgi:hypothetical protein
MEKSIRDGIETNSNAADFSGHAPPNPAQAAMMRNQNADAALISILTASPIRDAKLNDFFEEETKDGLYSRSRVEAAKGLLQRGNSKGLATMIQEWKTMDHNSRALDSSEELNLAEFLASSDSPDAVQALGQSLAKLGPLPRRNLIEIISFGGYVGTPQLPKQSPATLAAVEAVLVAELDDTEVVPKNALYRESGIAQELRFCDLAEAQLARRWPERYQFDLSASLADREQWRNTARSRVR